MIAWRCLDGIECTVAQQFNIESVTAITKSNVVSINCIDDIEHTVAQQFNIESITRVIKSNVVSTQLHIYDAYSHGIYVKKTLNSFFTSLNVALS